MELKTDRLILRELKQTDAEDIKEALNDLDISKNLISVPYPFTIKDAEKRIEYAEQEAESNERTDYYLGIEYNKKIIGEVSLSKVNKENKNGFLDFWISKKYWRKGICFEACKEVIKFAFEKLKLKTIESSAFEDNIASKKLLEKLGFEKKFLVEKKDKSLATGEIHDVQTYVLKN